MPNAIRIFLLMSMLLTSSVSFAQAGATAAAGGGHGKTTEAEALLAGLNMSRREAGAESLALLPSLEEVARQYSRELSERRILSHESPATGGPEDRVKRQGIRFGEVAQNIAHHHDLMSAWRSLLSSKEHRAQLMRKDLTHIGFAWTEGNDGVYLVQLLISQPVHKLPPPKVVINDQGAPTAPASPAGSAAQLPTFKLTQVNPQHKGYWKFESNRWWYFPVPKGARAGQLLWPDPSRKGPPPNYRR